MRKLILALLTTTLSTAAVTSVAACSVRTRQVNIFVNWNENTDVLSFDSNVRTGMLADGALQLLSAITYSEVRYQNDAIREEFLKILGANGLALSLEAVYENLSERTEDEEAFFASHRAARNTTFTEISFNDGETSSSYNLGDITPFLQTVSIDTTGNENITTHSEMTIADRTLSDFASDEDTKSSFSAFDFEDISIFGFDATTLTNTGVIVMEAEEDEIIKRPINSEFELIVSENNQLNQSAFYFSEVLLESFESTFVDPGNRNVDERSFRVSYSGFSGMVLRWIVNGTLISSTNNEGVITNEFAYWFEPFKYQFSLGFVADVGTEDMFNGIVFENGGPTVTITKL